MSADLLVWALPRLERLLPLDTDSLKEVIQYADTLPKDAAAEHLKNLLGDSNEAFDFISSFNVRRKNAAATAAISTGPPTSGVNSRQPSPPDDGVPRAKPRQAKKKANIHALPARQIEDRGEGSQVYHRKDEVDYMTVSRSKPIQGASLSTKPEIAPEGLKVVNTAGDSSLLRPAADTSNRITASKSAKASPVLTPTASRPTSRPSTPTSTALPHHPKPQPSPRSTARTTVKISGGKAMHGASSTLTDLDSAIRSLELQTNPSLSATSSADDASRQCNCMATQHPLLSAAPNCLNCGKIICLKQGLGPCTSCGEPLLSKEDIGSLLRVLKEERGHERQAENNKSHKRAEVATKPKAFSGRDFLSSTSASSSRIGSSAASPLGSREPSPGPTPAELLSAASTSMSHAPTSGTVVDRERQAAAQAHRDKLLNYQAQNAQRTTVHDEASDFALPSIGGDGTMKASGGMWASPAQRALELKKQQRMLAEMEFNAKPEWERKREVASIDVASGKVVRKFVQKKYEESQEKGRGSGEELVDHEQDGVRQSDGGGRGREEGNGAFSKNPLMGKMIRPVYKVEGQADGTVEEADEVKLREERRKRAQWRRVQDDLDDNEDVILDGGAKGFGFDRDIRVN